MGKPLYYSTHCDIHGSYHIRGLNHHKGKNVMKELLVLAPMGRKQRTQGGCPLCYKENKVKAREAQAAQPQLEAANG